MSKDYIEEQLIIPIYINEKVVLDMLAILEDGFSTVSQVNYSEHKENNSSQKVEAGAGVPISIWNKLFRIDLQTAIEHSGNKEKDENVIKEKVHTNVSLLSKFRTFLLKKKIIKKECDFTKVEIGDFIEIEGELQENPLINYMKIVLDALRIADVFEEKPDLGNKTQYRQKQQENNETIKKIQAFVNEMTHSGTIDFILSGDKVTTVLSAQEQYLSNDNVSEILGGRFKVLGKVIAICRDETTNVDLLRKTAFSILPDELINEAFSAFNSDDLKDFKLPELKTKIYGPAIIVIPVAIYA